jgi:undecaprenyl-diphosphatase
MFETLKQLDGQLLLRINSQHTPLLDEVMWFFSKTWPTVVFVLIFSFFVYRKLTIKKAAEIMLGCAITFACCDLSSTLFKENIKRYRPTHNENIKKKIHLVHGYEGGRYGFFSGHSANTFGIIIFLFLCGGYLKFRFRWLYFLYPLIVVYSRMYFGVHYPSDILGGFLDGLLFGTLVFFIMNKYFLKFNNEDSLQHI